jgi:hypothetical protein
MPATVERPILPHRLYRYRSLVPRDPYISPYDLLRREIEAIKEPYLWCSEFRMLNDPMEGFYRPSTRLQKVNNYEERVNQLLERKLNVGIVSFSDNRDNELMWAHYAGNYSGICIAYRTVGLVAGLPDDVALVRLGYDSRPPRIGNGDFANIRVILSQKKESWTYEREWRVLGPLGKVVITTRCVTHIYLGARVNPDHKINIRDELKGTDISISQMEVNGYRHNWQLVQRS